MDELEKEQQESSFKFISKVTLIGAVIIVLSGVVTGFLIARNSIGLQNLTGGTPGGIPGLSQVRKGQIFGSEDLKTFKDTTEGVLEKGGIDGEGSHRLIRLGGETQTAALTSSIVDLDLFVSHKIKVWGETQRAKKAGWLMDVGRVEVLE